jgi:hypothetical protein
LFSGRSSSHIHWYRAGPRAPPKSRDLASHLGPILVPDHVRYPALFTYDGTDGVVSLHRHYDEGVEVIFALMLQELTTFSDGDRLAVIGHDDVLLSLARSNLFAFVEGRDQQDATLPGEVMPRGLEFLGLRMDVFG